MGNIKFRRKLFTQWDETDNLKRMKDADILAEKKKTTGGFGKMVGSGAAGALAGAGAGAAIGGIASVAKTRGTAGLGKAIAKGGKWGAILGGAAAATGAYMSNRKQAQENQFYNKRLEYAQRQALRRERKDWKTNMTQRDGYSY